MVKRKQTHHRSDSEPAPKVQRSGHSTTSHSARSHSGTKLAQMQQPFRFLDLPPELRNTVYESLFADSATTIQPRAPAKYPNYNWRFKHQPCKGPSNVGLPALLAVSKQLREEAINVFYAGTEWVVRHYSHVTPLLTNLGRERVALITSLCWCHKRVASIDEDRRRTVAVWLMSLLDEEVRKHELDLDRQFLRVELRDLDGGLLAKMGWDEYRNELGSSTL